MRERNRGSRSTSRALVPLGLLLVCAPSSAGAQEWRYSVSFRPASGTDLQLDYTPPARREPVTPAPVRSFVGSLRNTTHRCSAPTTVKLEIFFEGRRVGGDVVLAPRNMLPSVRFPAGAYLINIYVARGGQWAFASRGNLAVQRDGWDFHYGCS